VSLLHLAVPLLHLAVPLLHLAVPILHLAVSLLHLAVPLLHIDSRRWSLEIEGKYMVAHCVSRLNLFSPVTTRPCIWTAQWPQGRGVGRCTHPPRAALCPCAVQNAAEKYWFLRMRMRSGRPELIWLPPRTRPTARPQSGMGQGNSPAAAGRPERPG
jgi:hypothetical protein